MLDPKEKAQWASEHTIANLNKCQEQTTRRPDWLESAKQKVEKVLLYVKAAADVKILRGRTYCSQRTKRQAV
jgi:hypothetical protein